MPANSFQGKLVITPAPSPEILSAEVAPRCSIQAQAVSACCSMLWLCLLFNEAMKPTPQASRSSVS